MAKSIIYLIKKNIKQSGINYVLLIILFFYFLFFLKNLKYFCIYANYLKQLVKILGVPTRGSNHNEVLIKSDKSPSGGSPRATTIEAKKGR
jgi:hypothetical protein